MLVSIIVITYNSSQYVLETLESAFRQTYNEIELIVSDDCSTDNTFELCQQWIEKHKERFVRTLCTQTPHNGGIVWNYNHALQYAQGEWIKYIAGDDILCYNCIDILVHNIKPNIFLYFADIYEWNTNTGFVRIQGPNIPKTSWKRQLRHILTNLSVVPGPTIFVEKEHLIEVGGFDSRYPLLEDLPLLLRYLTNKLRVDFVDSPIVIWRSHSSNTSKTNPIFLNCIYNVCVYYSKKYCLPLGIPLHTYHYFTDKYISENYEKGGFHRTIGYFLRMADLVHWKWKVSPPKANNPQKSNNFPFSQALIENHEYDLQQQ